MLLLKLLLQRPTAAGGIKCLSACQFRRNITFISCLEIENCADMGKMLANKMRCNLFHALMTLDELLLLPSTISEAIALKSDLLSTSVYICIYSHIYAYILQIYVNIAQFTHSRSHSSFISLYCFGLMRHSSNVVM